MKDDDPSAIPHIQWIPEYYREIHTLIGPNAPPPKQSPAGTHGITSSPDEFDAAHEHAMAEISRPTLIGQTRRPSSQALSPLLKMEASFRRSISTAISDIELEVQMRRKPSDLWPPLLNARQRIAIRQELFGAVVLPIVSGRPEFEKLVSEHGLPAALRIACHHHATRETVLADHLFEAIEPLPNAYADAARRYDQSLKLDAKSLIGRDLSIGEKRAELYRTEIAAVSERIAATPSAPGGRSPEEMNDLNTLLGQKESLERKKASLDATLAALRAADQTPALRELIAKHGYQATIRATRECLTSTRASRSIEERPEHLSDAKLVEIEGRLLLQPDFDAIDREIAALPVGVEEPVHLRRFELDFKLDALRSVSGFPSFGALVEERGLAAALDLAVPAWKAAMEARLTRDADFVSVFESGLQAADTTEQAPENDMAA